MTMRAPQTLSAIVKPISWRIPLPLSGLVSKYGLLDACTEWVGLSERPRGSTLLSTLNLQWPPNHATYTVPTNIVYQIPMATVFGAGVPIPAGVAPTLDIDTDLIRGVILAARV